MTVKLVAFSRKGVRKDFALENGPVIIGRTPEAQVQVPVQEVSRRHCELQFSGNRIQLKDLGSSNGTFVNDHKVSNAILHAGDRLRVGPITFVVQIDGQPKEISPAMLAAAPKPAPAAKKAPPEAATKITPPPAKQPPKAEASDELDLDNLDVEDLSDFDLDDISPMSPSADSSDLGDLEEIEDVEELGSDDIIAEDDEEPPAKGKKK